MRNIVEKGFTLVELLLAITIMGVIAGATMPLLSTMLNAHASLSARSSLYQEGVMIMERITGGLRKTTIVAVPNGHNTTRDILAFSRLVNTDNDFYFGDPLFPRIDEDTFLYFSIGGFGILGIDDNGNGMIDDNSKNDDDEDGMVNEDWLDGIDNDGDGSIDEEMQADSIGNGVAGIAGIDDDGDGQVDEGGGSLAEDDDEDGVKNEENILFAVYVYNSSVNTLTEIHSDPVTGINSPAPQVVLSTQVTNFEARYKTPTLIEIALELTGEDGKVVTLTENVYVRNVLQKTGKVVR